MILSDVFGITLSVVGFLLSLQGLWLLCRALWPVRVEAASRRCEGNRIACFFIGLLITGVVALIIRAAAMQMGAPGKMAAAVVLFFYVMFAGVGMSGLVTHIGRRLESPADAGRAWRATVRGGVALELACLIPVLGWFGILPISLIIGAGASMMAIFTRTESPAIAQALRSPLPPELPRRMVASRSSEQSSVDAEGVLR